MSDGIVGMGTIILILLIIAVVYFVRQNSSGKTSGSGYNNYNQQQMNQQTNNQQMNQRQMNQQTNNQQMNQRQMNQQTNNQQMHRQQMNAQQPNIQQNNPSFVQKMENKTQQMNNYAKTGNAGSAPQLKNNGRSNNDGSGYVCACAKCNQKLDIAYGIMGGFCRNCNAWSYDRVAHNQKLKQFGASASTYTILVKYPQVHVRINGADRYPSMTVTPNMIILYDTLGWRLDIPFASLKANTASKGIAQQLTLIMDSNGTPLSINIDMQGGSYDDLSGEDLYRINKLITEG